MRARAFLAILAHAALILSCAHPEAMPRDPESPRGATELSASGDGDGEEGLATWYGSSFAGRRTASGERFDPNAMTAAHRTLRFGTWVDVVRLDTGQRVRVRITDRGPFGGGGRIIDLSRAAAERLGIVKSGRARVHVYVVQAP